ncbi:MAG: signal recognition particle-docking protein FtsY [Chloroflexota bacterium]|nr:signal recognition particle-docking protein FtsY [Chloroflexota bacterium]MDE2919938.1 signal recognition particle-docking protein FtsY [Chloroflexota bacterium]
MLLKRLRRTQRMEAPETEAAPAPAVEPTRRRFSTVRRWLSRSKLSEADWDELEELLIAADLGPFLTMELLDELRETVQADGTADPEAARELLAVRLTEALGGHEAQFASGPPPQVVFVVGVNGAGKTTSIGKLAHLLKSTGHEVLLAAGDTFRAGAIDQLQIWAERVGVPVIAHQPGGDPGAVIYDALDAAQARGAEYVIADSAGRQHNNANLMNELGKMRRVAERKTPGAPHEVLLVLDALTGQNGLHQAQGFLETANVTGIVLTKLDSSAKGGAAFAVTRATGLPIKFVGVGEGLTDFEPFDPERFVQALLEPQPGDADDEEET